MKGPQTIERSLRVYKPTQNTICVALNIPLLVSCVCKLKDEQFNYLIQCTVFFASCDPLFSQFRVPPYFPSLGLTLKEKFTGYFSTLNHINGAPGLAWNA